MYIRYLPLSTYSNQYASQWIQVSSRASRQQPLRTGYITVGHSEVERSLPEVPVVLCSIYSTCAHKYKRLF